MRRPHSRNDPLDDPHQVLFIGEDHTGRFQATETFDEHFGRMIDQDVADRVVVHQRLQRAESENFVEQFPLQAFALRDINHGGVFGNQFCRQNLHFAREFGFGNMCEQRQIERIDHFLVEADFHPLVFQLASVGIRIRVRIGWFEH